MANASSILSRSFIPSFVLMCCSYSIAFGQDQSGYLIETGPAPKASAEIVVTSHGISPVIHKAFIDMDHGEWTGNEDSDVAKLWPEEHAAWITNPHTVRPPGGTTLQEVFKRSFTAMEGLAEKHDGETIAIFSHRVAGRLLLIGALSTGSERFPFIIQGNCCINEIERIQSGYLIRSINDVSHIKNAGIDLLQADF